MTKLFSISILCCFSIGLLTPAIAETSVNTNAAAEADTTNESSVQAASDTLSEEATAEIDTLLTSAHFDDKTADLSPEPNSEKWGWTDDKRKDVKDKLNEWANNMDGWFGEPEPEKPARASLRLVLDTRWANDPKTGSDVTVKPRVRGRLRLPVLEKRLSLIIGDEDLDDDTFLKQSAAGDTDQAATNRQDRLVNTRQTRDDNASLALRWSRFDDEIERQLGVKTDVDLGVRSVDDIYVKISVDKNWYEGDRLTVSNDNFYRYGLDSKHYVRGGLTLKYGSDANRFINNRTTIRYRNRDDEESTDWGNDLRQVHYMGNEKQLAYGISTSGYFDTDKKLLNSYGPAISYRQPVWREWLYVQTELNYYNDKTEDKDHFPSALLRMEALF